VPAEVKRASGAHLQIPLPCRRAAESVLLSRFLTVYSVQKSREHVHQKDKLHMPYSRVPREAEQAIETLLKLAHYVELIDHTRGRIATRVSLSNIPKVLGLLQGLDVNRGLESMSGLMDYEVSVWSRSATIKYDSNVLPMDLLNDFCAIRNDPSLEESVRRRLYSLFESLSG
jgi:hypothetical protein